MMMTVTLTMTQTMKMTIVFETGTDIRDALKDFVG